ncbi:unnamed protein product [Gadus morhua 'NCC']
MCSLILAREQSHLGRRRGQVMGGAGGRGDGGGGPPLTGAGSSPSQVGIHHCSGGHLYSDSFVNVNYCSLSGVLSAQGEVCLQGPWPLPGCCRE